MGETKGPSLVVLAAGIGSRYGGFKQLDSIGRNNESIMDLSIEDAIQAGFEKVILVVNRQISAQIKDQIIAKFQTRVEIHPIYQELTAVPPEFTVPAARKKPWGTAHAVLTARPLVETPFAVINADDFYGRSAFFRMKELLSSTAPNATDYHMLGYYLKNTLSNHGGVSRGLCRITDGLLSSIKEVQNIKRSTDGIYGDYNGTSLELSPDAIVSMNFWGFTPQVFALLEDQFSTFLHNNLNDLKAEYFLTEALDYAIANKLGNIYVSATSERWFGVTFREDRDEVRKGIQNYLSTG